MPKSSPSPLRSPRRTIFDFSTSSSDQNPAASKPAAAKKRNTKSGKKSAVEKPISLKYNGSHKPFYFFHPVDKIENVRWPSSTYIRRPLWKNYNSALGQRNPDEFELQLEGPQWTGEAKILWNRRARALGIRRKVQVWARNGEEGQGQGVEGLEGLEDRQRKTHATAEILFIVRSRQLREITRLREISGNYL